MGWYRSTWYRSGSLWGEQGRHSHASISQDFWNPHHTCREDKREVILHIALVPPVQEVHDILHHCHIAPSEPERVSQHVALGLLARRATQSYLYRIKYGQLASKEMVSAPATPEHKPSWALSSSTIPPYLPEVPVASG